MNDVVEGDLDAVLVLVVVLCWAIPSTVLSYGVADVVALGHPKHCYSRTHSRSCC